MTKFYHLCQRGDLDSLRALNNKRKEIQIELDKYRLYCVEIDTDDKCERLIDDLGDISYEIGKIIDRLECVENDRLN
jgi:hypothetical protein